MNNTKFLISFYIFTIFLCLTFSFVNSRKYKYESSYAFLSLIVENEEKRFCINFQQWKQKELPSSFEEALILNLFWWNNVNNTNICKENKISKFPSNAIVPADYITEFNKLRQLCYGQPGFNSSDPNSVKNEVKIMKNAFIKNILFLVEKGKLNAYGLHNYLFTHFYNAEINNTEDKSLNVFYVYKNNFWQEIEPLISKIDQLRIYQPKSFFPMDPAVVVLWGFAFISILLGSLWSVMDVKSKLAVREQISTALGNLQSNQNASLTYENTGVSSSTIQNERKRSTQSSELANMNVYQHCISVFVALSVVVFVLMFAFFFRNYAVNAFNFFLISLGSVAIKSCIYAILQYLLNGFDYEMFSLRQLFCLKRRELNNQQNIQINSSEVNIIQQNSSKKSFLDNPFLLFSSLSFIFSFGICLYWFSIRNKYYAFYLLDFINITICIYAIRFSRIRSLRLITFLLLAMFVYDLFMVFGTRLLTTDGCSVMLQVVTGTDCQPTKSPDREFQPVAPIDITKLPEKLSLLFYMPLLADPMAECFDLQVEKEFKNVLLGLGDVILPGYLIAYCFYVDLIKKSKFHLYGFISLIGYSFGMFCTFIALLLMETGQPALIYLVPFTLLPICFWGFFVDSEGTLGKMWRGEI